MNKAKEYHLNFIVRLTRWGIKEPAIICDNISGNVAKYQPVASFVSGCGVLMVDDIMRDIGTLNAFNSPVLGYTIWSGNEHDNIEIVSPPPQVLCWSSYEVAMPLQDFLDVMNEWKEFLESLSFEHTLLNK